MPDARSPADARQQDFLPLSAAGTWRATSGQPAAREGARPPRGRGGPGRREGGARRTGGGGAGRRGGGARLTGGRRGGAGRREGGARRAGVRGGGARVGNVPQRPPHSRPFPRLCALEGRTQPPCEVQAALATPWRPPLSASSSQPSASHPTARAQSLPLAATGGGGLRAGWGRATGGEAEPMRGKQRRGGGKWAGSRLMGWTVISSAPGKTQARRLAVDPETSPAQC